MRDFYRNRKASIKGDGPPTPPPSYRPTSLIPAIIASDRLYFSAANPLTASQQEGLILRVRRHTDVFDVIPADTRMIRRLASDFGSVPVESTIGQDAGATIVNLRRYKMLRSITHEAIFSTMSRDDALQFGKRLVNDIGNYVVACCPDWKVKPWLLDNR